MGAKPEHPTCPSCGARVADGAETCDLCGRSIAAPTGEADGVAAEAEVPAGGGETALPRPTPTTPSGHGPYCNQCGWQNPDGARFCSMCGAPLQAVPHHPARPPRTARSTAPPQKPQRRTHATQSGPDDGRRRAGIVVAAGAMLVLAFYLIAAVQSDPSPTPGGPPTQGPGAELSLDLARRAAALEEAIAGLDGAAKLERQRELVQLFAGARRFDRAAVEQEKIAQIENTAAAWAAAGNFFYDWAATAAPADRAEPARRAVAAYERVLEEEPDNLDVRTDMAAVYQWDPAMTEEAIRQTQIVLDANPAHVQANFNMGIFLMRQERTEEAVARFERVLSLEPEGTPTHERAHELIRFARQRDGRSGSGS